MEGEPIIREAAEMYEHQKELARIRQKRFYDAKKDDILKKRKADRRELKRLRRQVEAMQVAAPRANRRNAPQVPAAFTDTEIADKKKEAKKIKWTLAKVKEELEKLRNTVNRTTHEQQNDTGLNNHIRHIATVYRLTKCPVEENFKKCLEKFAVIKKGIDEGHQLEQPDKTYSLNSKKNFFQSILFVLNNLYVPITDLNIKKYETEYETLDIQSREQQKVREQSEEHAVIPYDQILKKVDEEYPEGSKQRLIMHMYDEFNGRDNFGRLKIVHRNVGDDDTLKAVMKRQQQEKKIPDNYLIVPRTATSKLEIVLVDYKTNQKYGVIRQALSAELSEMIRKYMEKEGIKYDDYLFNGKQSTYVGKIMRKVGIPKGGQAINYIRHSKKTEIFQKNPNMTAEEQLKVAKAFMHSPQVSLAYIRKVKLI